jgi:phosphoribosylglycinamide formyltransferase
MIHYVIAQVDRERRRRERGAPILIKEMPFVEGIDEDIEIFKEKLHQTE